MLKRAVPRALKLNDDGHHLTLAQCALSDSLDFAIINQVSMVFRQKVTAEVINVTK
jgi:hypothetical protein